MVVKILELKSCNDGCKFYDQEWRDFNRYCSFKTKRGRLIDDSPFPKWCPLESKPPSVTVNMRTTNKQYGDNPFNIKDTKTKNKNKKGVKC